MMNVVLIHGFCENHTIWSDFKKLLPKEFTYHTPNLSELTSCQKMDEYAKHIKSDLDEKNIEKVILIGHSMGGYIALAFAHLFPNMVAGVGLFHSTAYADNEEKKEARLKTVQYIVKHGAREFIQDFLPNMFNAAFKKEHAAYVDEKVDEYAKKMSEEALIAATLAMRERKDHSKILKEATYPILIIAGGKDKYVPLAGSIEQVALLKNPYCLIVSHIAHAGMLEAPAITAQTVTEFLNNC